MPDDAGPVRLEGPLVDRVSPSDLSMLWPDDLGWSQEVGALAIVDGDRLLDDDGRIAVDAVRAHVAARLHRLPRLRQRLRRPPLWLGRPYWEDAADLDLAHHVRVVHLDVPAGEGRLLAACADLLARPLDEARPRWGLWLLTGLTDGRVGLFVRMHHTLVDGAAGVAALAVLLDDEPVAPGTGAAPPPWRPSPPPRRRDLVADLWLRAARRAWRLGQHVRHPARLGRRLRRAVMAVRAIVAQADAPRTSLNQRVGGRRRIVLVRSDLAAVRAAAHDAGGTVNDALLAAVAGGLRALLRGRGELPAGDRPRATVPVAGGSRAASGNSTASSLVVPLPVDVDGPSDRIGVIAAETGRQKAAPLSFDDAGILHSPTLERLAVRFAASQRVANLLVSNVPGPRAPLHLLGAPVLEVFPVVPLVGNLSVGVGALSYAGQLNLGIVADPTICPDVAVLADGVRRSLERLTGTVPRVSVTPVEAGG